jgi:hypothetical protein
MRGWLEFRSGEDASKPSLDAIRFDMAGYEYRGEAEPGELRVWYTPEGDGLGLFFFPIPPDLPADAGSMDELAAFYRRLPDDSDGRLVEVRVLEAGGCPAIRTVLSFPQRPSGRTYLGSLCVPFRDFSFVLKCQCAERGDTGLKAAVLLARSLAGGEPMRSKGERSHLAGFDPDNPRHDDEFPHDPVARVRRVLDHLAGSLMVAAGVKRLPGFALPRGEA